MCSPQSISSRIFDILSRIIIRLRDPKTFSLDVHPPLILIWHFVMNSDDRNSADSTANLLHTRLHITILLIHGFSPRTGPINGTINDSIILQMLTVTYPRSILCYGITITNLYLRSHITTVQCIFALRDLTSQQLHTN